MAIIMEGKPIAEKVLAEVKGEISALAKKRIIPSLTVVLVGNDPASMAYVNSKERKSRELGINSRKISLPEKTSEIELLSLVEKLNKDKSVHAILVQFPLPKQINERHVRDSILPEKDVDGLNSVSIGKLLNGDETLAPCTPKGIIRMLEEHKVAIEGKHAVVVGRSLLVGKPIANMLLNRNATVTICHSKTKNLSEITKGADILIVAVGKPHLVGANMVKTGAVVIDVGINRLGGQTVKEDVEMGIKGAKEKSASHAFANPDQKPKFVGDVDFESVSKKASKISPVPGGVGPMTIAMLMRNTVNCAKLQNGLA
ncbi:MAG: bifunctional 5,10-methylenetetrahydrofolate dehydrogenase/5,10-methenyltetrahydrofolate cyclohydrolase [Candidatus Micrarchaeota archaeon]